jgi:hypothetical protein
MLFLLMAHRSVEMTAAQVVGQMVLKKADNKAE